MLSMRVCITLYACEKLWQDLHYVCRRFLCVFTISFIKSSSNIQNMEVIEMGKTWKFILRFSLPGELLRAIRKACFYIVCMHQRERANLFFILFFFFSLLYITHLFFIVSYFDFVGVWFCSCCYCWSNNVIIIFFFILNLLMQRNVMHIFSLFHFFSPSIEVSFMQFPISFAHTAELTEVK